MGLLTRHLLPRHVRRVCRANGGEKHQEIRTRLHGLLRGRLRRHGREHRPELPAGRVHLLWRDHGHRPGRRLSDSGQEPDALVRRQQGPRHRHRRRRLRPGQGHCQPTDGISHRHGWPGQHVLHPRRGLRGDDVRRLPAHQASGRLGVRSRDLTRQPQDNPQEARVLGHLDSLLYQHHLRPGPHQPREGHPARCAQGLPAVCST